MTRIVNETRGTGLASEARWARRPWERMRGLLGRGSLPEGQALIFPRAGAVHTCFMRFAIDVVFLDRDGGVLKATSNLAPFRFTAARRAQTCLELPAGTVERSGTQAGDHITFQEVRHDPVRTQSAT